MTKFFRRNIARQPEEITASPELQETLHRIDPTQSTFSLRFDEKGNLTGFTIKKPKLTKEEKRRIAQETRSKAAGEELPAKGIKGKVKRIFSKIRRRKSTKEGGSRVSGIGGKIKGLIPRRSKK